MSWNSSSTRGSMISQRMRRLSTRGARPPTLGTSMVSSLSRLALCALPNFTLIFSASTIGVRRPTAMSLVRWLPPSGITLVCWMAPPEKIARSVVPPPMSTSATPSSFSSSASTASAEASGSSTMSATCSPVRPQHLTMFWALLTAAVTMCTFASRRTPLIPSGSRMPSCSSMMYSCVRTWRISRSCGMLMARAASRTRSRSPCFTSLSFTATTPCELKPRM